MSLIDEINAWRLRRVDAMKDGNYITTAASCASSGDNTLIAAPGADKRIVIGFFLIQALSTLATTCTLKDGSTARYIFLAQNQGDGLARSFELGCELRLSTNTALVLNLSAANDVAYSLEYFVEHT